MDTIVYQGLIGLTAAMFLWLVSAGLTIAFGVCGILNIAHGVLYMFGGYFLLTFYQLLGMNFWLSILLALLSVGFIGLVLELGFLRPIYKEPIEIQLVLTFAFVWVFDDLAKLAWGPVSKIVAMPGFFEGFVPIIGRPFPVYNIFIIGAGLATAIIIWLLLDKTWWGKSIRASALDREMASALGINIRTLFSGAFMFAAAIAALGGALSVPMRVVGPGIGGAIIVQAFVVTVIGGLGNLKGAFVGALIVGVVGAFCTLYIPVFEMFIIYIIMAVVLLIRPQGIFGEIK